MLESFSLRFSIVSLSWRQTPNMIEINERHEAVSISGVKVPQQESVA